MHSLQHVKTQVLTYHGTDELNPTIMGYSDADWDGDPDTSKSTSGHVFMICGGVIGWSSKRQNLVALSSQESEYIGLANPGMHLVWLQMFFEDIGAPQENPTTLFCDNQAAIAGSKDSDTCCRTRHIACKYYYI